MDNWRRKEDKRERYTENVHNLPTLPDVAVRPHTSVSDMVTSIVEDSIDSNNKKIDIPGFKKRKTRERRRLVFIKRKMAGLVFGYRYWENTQLLSSKFTDQQTET